ncbi:MAG: nucleoside kinase [Bacteroidales bacterium]|nr:nucleoside kinase [Bacteroidales bacterium]
MTQTVQIKCLNTASVKPVPRGTSLQQIIEEFGVEMKNQILGALVNNVLEELSYEVFHPKTILFIDITHPEGKRLYFRSLSFLLYKAINELFPGSHLRVEHSVSRGVYCEVDHPSAPFNKQDSDKIKHRMRKIVEDDLPFILVEEETEEVIRKFDAQGLSDKKSLLVQHGQTYASYYKLNGHIDFFYGPLVPSTGYLKVFDLNPYYEGLLMQLPKKDNVSEVEGMIVQDKLFEIFHEFTTWNRILEVPNVGDLNHSCSNGKSETLIKVSEALHEKKIGQIADMINSRNHKIKIVLISGPSSSGKTTFGKRLAVQLMVNGLKPLNLSLDNYFVDREKTPKDENGEYDFEALDALDLDLFNQNLLDLLDGKMVEIPRFSFEKGTRSYEGTEMKMNSDNILIIEGIHGLNPRLTESIPPDIKFKVYVSALTSLNMDDHNRVSTTDNRLIRRIVRDYRYRNYSARETISRWPSVSRGEEIHIFPYQEEADIMFNSALNYELAVLKTLAEPILREVQPNLPEYAEARRLLNFFSYFKPMKAREIPPTSILREFLGGSSFNY